MSVSVCARAPCNHHLKTIGFDPKFDGVVWFCYPVGASSTLLHVWIRSTWRICPGPGNILTSVINAEFFFFFSVSF